MYIIHDEKSLNRYIIRLNELMVLYNLEMLTLDEVELKLKIHLMSLTIPAKQLQYFAEQRHYWLSRYESSANQELIEQLKETKNISDPEIIEAEYVPIRKI